MISRVIFQSSSLARVYPPCRAASSRRPARQAAKVFSALLKANCSRIYVLVFLIGIRMPTIPRTVSPACRLHNTICILHLQGGRRCVQHGRVKMGYVLRSLPRLSAGQRRTVALTSLARPRTELYVILCPCSHRLLLKKKTECYAPAIQFDDHTHRRNNVAFL